MKRCKKCGECKVCNNALGDFDDDPVLIEAAFRYVRGPVVRHPQLDRRLAELKARYPGGAARASEPSARPK